MVGKDGTRDGVNLQAWQRYEAVCRLCNTAARLDLWWGGLLLPKGWRRMYGIKKQTSCSGLPARLLSFMVTIYCEPRCFTKRGYGLPEQFRQRHRISWAARQRNKKSKKKNIKNGSAAKGRPKICSQKSLEQPEERTCLRENVRFVAARRPGGHQILGGLGNVSRTQRIKKTLV